MAAPVAAAGSGLVGYLAALPLMGQLLFGTFLLGVPAILIWARQTGNPREFQMMLAAMVLIGAGFTMRHVRFGHSGMLVLFALIAGFSIFFLRNFAQALGASGQIPIVLAAWGPPAVAVLLSMGLLLHLEDG